MSGRSIDNAVTDKRHHVYHPGLGKQLAVKPFFKIGEVAKLLGVKPHVLRYWESEFPSLRPKKNPSGQRIYARADIEAIVEIQNLLYNERYTISGAKQMLARQGGTPLAPPAEIPSGPLPQVLADLKTHVHELLVLLDRMPIP
jgi:DNA-binding transcriptional MerR regulator